MIIRLLPKTRYDFATLTSNGASIEMIVAKGVDISTYREGNLIFRLHQFNVSGGTGPAKVKAILKPDAPTGEDPGAEWGIYPSSTELASSEIDFSSVIRAGEFTLTNLTAPLGGWCKLLLKPTQGTTVYSTFNCILSADLVLKNG